MIRDYPRTTIAALAVSAAGFIGYISSEGWAPEAMIPVPGDVPTMGFGSTTKEDGSPVKMGDSITPVRAARLSLAQIAEGEARLRRCFGPTVKLYQNEWDAYNRLAGNTGAGRVCNSSIPTKLQAEQYEAACRTIGEFVCGPATEKTRAKPGEKCYSAKRPLRVLKGLENRRKEEVAQCLG